MDILYISKTGKLLNKPNTKDSERMKRVLTGISEATEFAVFIILLVVTFITSLSAPMREIVLAQSSPEEAISTTLALGFVLYFWLKNFLSKNPPLNKTNTPDFFDKIGVPLEFYFSVPFHIYTTIRKIMWKIKAKN